MASERNRTEEKKTYTVGEIAEMLGISDKVAYTLVKSGQFKYVRVGRAIRVSKSSFDSWLEPNKPTRRRFDMAAIKQRKTKYSVIYWYVNEQGERKQKWDTVDTIGEAKSRKVFVEFYQEKYGQAIVPNEETYFQRVADEKAKTGKEGGTDEHDSGSEPVRRRTPTQKSAITPQKDDITFSEFLKHYVKVYGTSKWSMSTYSGKTGLIRNYIDPYIGDKKLSEITTECLSEYYNDLLSVERVPPANQKKTGKCVAPSGVKKIHDVIRSALNQAMKWNYLDPMMQNPAKLATLPTMKKTKRKVWSVSTFREALPRVEDDILALAMNLAFSCSLRVGEITGLTWDCIFIDEESIENGNARIIINKEVARVSIEALQRLNERDVLVTFPAQKPHCTTRLVLKTPKTETSTRVVWLPKTVAHMLVEHRKNQEELKEFLGADYHDYNLVVALENGNPVESRIIRKRLQVFCDTTGYERVDFHSLRHLSTKYKLKLTQGDIKSVQGDTGHAEAQMVTDVYSEIEDENRRENAARMEADFYSPTAKNGKSSATEDIGEALAAILKTLSPEQLSALVSAAR